MKIVEKMGGIRKTTRRLRLAMATEIDSQLTREPRKNKQKSADTRKSHCGLYYKYNAEYFSRFRFDVDRFQNTPASLSRANSPAQALLVDDRNGLHIHMTQYLFE